MSIKVTQPRDKQLNPQSQHYFKPQSSHNHNMSYEDAIMMTPNAKRYRNDTCMMSSYSKAEFDTTQQQHQSIAREIYLPTEMDKLKKLFPFLDNEVKFIKYSKILQQIQEVLKECDKDCSKAYNKLLTQKNPNLKDEQGKALLSKRVGAPQQFSQDPNQNQSALSSARQSKKRRRDDYESDYSSIMDMNQVSLRSSVSVQNSSNLQQQSQQISAQQLQPNTQNSSQNQNQQLVNHSQAQQIQQQIQERPLEESYAENSVKELMNIQCAEDAYKVLNNMFKTFKQESSKKYIEAIKVCLRDNQILKKGVIIQNKRSQEAMQKAADYDQLFEVVQKQAEEIGFLKSQNAQLSTSLMKSQFKPMMNPNWYNSNNHFGGDPSVL
ncbi:UNKNOWN [Stylonychia lemnae]|uniref:Uncharacterized protein n=1 Tax=Stylonychia lemnae TaxID=5949 RepID=A0A078B9H3_STYLE|nr:UNKNOWN [Stylonychia lemnae]|eukprot:CDW91069.1 UNKNOWN [Stylonychia lemnae]